MMRGGPRIAVAVRRLDGAIALRRMNGSRYALSKTPLWRGVINFVAMLRMGVECLTISVDMMGGEAEEPSRFEKWLSRKLGRDAMDIAAGASLLLGLGLAILLFFVLPSLIASWLTARIEHTLVINLIEGVVRLGIFVGYLAVISLLRDIRRFFAYHGAEHRTVNCYEKGFPLTVENVQRCSTAHPRCGTSFLLLVMVVSILIFSLTGWRGPWYGRLLIRLALLPVVAAVSYEMLMGLARFDNRLAAAIRAPGMWLQRMTTRPPDDGMAEVAIAAFVACLPPEEWAECVPEGYRLPDEDRPETSETPPEAPRDETSNPAEAPPSNRSAP
jgi:uncharacterized protein YqhQ